jgi:hypothetical protein
LARLRLARHQQRAVVYVCGMGFAGEQRTILPYP